MAGLMNCRCNRMTISDTWLTRCRTVLTTSLLVTWPTSTSPMSTANFKLSVVAIVTTWSGLLMSPNTAGSIGTSIGTAVCAPRVRRQTNYRIYNGHYARVRQDINDLPTTNLHNNYAILHELDFVEVFERKATKSYYIGIT